VKVDAAGLAVEPTGATATETSLARAIVGTWIGSAEFARLARRDAATGTDDDLPRPAERCFERIARRSVRLARRTFVARHREHQHDDNVANDSRHAIHGLGSMPEVPESPALVI